jgi:PA-IL-like protein
MSLSFPEVVMKKVLVRFLITFALIIGVSLPMLADTIRLKDGSVIRGQIVGFKNEQFTIMVGSGTRGRKSRITVYMEDVDSIEFDSAGGSNTPNTPDETSTTSSQPTYQPPTNQQQQQPPTPTNQPTPTSGSPTSGNNPTFFQIKVSVRADNASNGWTNSGLVVRRGQRLRINATGRVNLGNNRTSTPDGMANVPDRDKLMRNQPTGGLIAVIGDDNDDFIFVGRGRDFVAQRDGVLFLGVNEGNLSDNSGMFEVVIEAETMTGNPR